MTSSHARQSYSPDYWDIVSSQLSKRVSVMVSLAILVLFYAVAIYAPLLANDRPLFFKGVDRAAYRLAHGQLSLVSQELAGLATAEPVPDLDAVGREAAGVTMRLEIMRRSLASADELLLDAIDAKVTALCTRLDAGERRQVVAVAAELMALAARVPDELRAAETGGAASPGSGVVLVPYAEFPAFENLGRGDLFFMILWAIVMLAPAWNRLVNRMVLDGDPNRIRDARRYKVLVFVIVPLLGAIVWQGQQAASHVTTYKTGLVSGDVVAERVIFAPIPYGIAESNTSENFRPPTWHLESEIGAEGYYEFGARSGRFDPATGIPKLALPVDVRFGERGRNHPLRHPLGTDSLGRDMLTRLIWGARVSLAVGLVSTILLVFIGTIVGSIAGYYGGWVDLIISRIIEIVQTFPFFFLILIVVAFVGPSILNIMLGIGLIRWTGVARLVRGEFIRLREQDFVVASQALGASSARTIFRHILPNALGPVLVAATFSVAAGILTESGLSFLGFGIQLPIPSWGSVLIESSSAEHWWIQIYPGLLIFAPAPLYTCMGEGVRDAPDPRLKGA